MSVNQLGDNFDYPVQNAGAGHIALALVLDVSGSMTKDDRIGALNKAVNDLIVQIKTDTRLDKIVDLGIFVFGENGREPVYQGFRAVADCAQVNLQATDNSTYVVNALNTAVDRLRERTMQYASGTAYKPWLVLITDGEFHDVSTLNTIGDRMKQREQDGKLQFFGLGVVGYQRSQLESLTNRPDHVIDVKDTNNFTEFLSWVGKSFAKISTNAIDASINLGVPSLTGYMS